MNSTAMATSEFGEQFLAFRLGAETYAVSVNNVREIIGGDTLTRLPQTPDFILGVMNLRGAIVPVIDLRRRFAIASPEHESPVQIVVILDIAGESQRRTVGVLVDDVLDVVAFDREHIAEPPDLGNAISARYLYGIVTEDKDVVVLLNADRLFSLAELSELEDIHDEQ